MKYIFSLVISAVLVISLGVAPLKASAYTPNQSQQQTIQLLLQLISLLQIQLAAMLDESEDNEEEETEVSTVSKQDLSISSITLSDSEINWSASTPRPDQVLEIEVKNNQYGSYNLSGKKFKYAVYVYEVDEDGDKSETAIESTGEAYVPYASGYTSIEVAVEGGLGTKTEQEYQAKIVIDTEDDVDESNERNNTKWSSTWSTIKEGVEGMSVVLKMGTLSRDSFDADPNSEITFNYFPEGDIDICVVTAQYEGGNMEVEHEWDGNVGSGESGKVVFGAVGTYPLLALEKVKVVCENDDDSISDSISYNVYDDELSDYRITIGDDEEVYKEDDNGTEIEAISYCMEAYNDSDIHNNTRVRCYWDGDKFEDVSSFKG